MPDPTPDQDPLDRAADEFLARLRGGERPSVDEFAARYPDLAADIRETFPVLLAVERVKDPAAIAHPVAVGDYRVVRWVGGGGMGDVYEAVQAALGRRVALKVMRPRGGAHPERFRREARAAARLHHTNIVPVFDSGERDGVLYYAMQFIPGKGLDAVVADLRRLRGAPAEPLDAISGGVLSGSFAAASPAAADDTTVSTATSWAASPRREFYRSVARIGADAAAALGHAHREGVLHRDVKPSNLLIDARGTVWVTDFGLAKAGGDDDLTRSGDVVGTLRYMAPERFDHWSGPAADVYGLGLTLYELVTLRPAYDGPADPQLVRRILSDAPPRPSAHDPDVPRDLETVILKATARRPEDRYPTADALADDLRRFAGDQPVLARRATAVERAVRACRRNPVLTAALSAVVVTAVTGAAVSGWFAWRSSEHAAAALTQSEKARRNEDRAKAAVRSLVDGVVGRELGRRGELTDAERAYFEAVLRQYEVTFAGDESEDLAAVAEGYFGVAKLQAVLGQSVDAAASYRHAIDRLDRRLAADPADRPARGLRVRCLHNLAAAETDAGRLPEAEGLLARCLADAEALAAAEPGRGDHRAAALQARAWLATTRRALGRGGDATTVLTEAVAAAEREHARAPDDGDVRGCLLTLYSEVARDADARRDHAAAAQALGRAADLAAAMPDDPDRPDSPAAVAGRALSGLAGSLLAAGKLDAAAAAAERAVDVTARAAAAYPLSEVAWVQALARCRRAALRQAAGDLRAAEEDYADALAGAEAVQRRFQAPTADLQTVVAEAASGLAAVRRRLNPGLDVTPLYQRAEAAVAGILARNPNAHDRRRMLVELLLDAAGHQDELRRTAAADAVAARAAGHVEELAARAPADPDVRLFRVRVRIGQAYQFANAGKPADGRARVAEAMALLGDAGANPAARELVAKAHVTSALVALRAGDPARAAADARTGADLLRALLRDDPDRATARSLLAAALVLVPLTPATAREAIAVLDGVPDHKLHGQDRSIYAVAANELGLTDLRANPAAALALFRKGVRMLEPVADLSADEFGVRTVLGGLLVNAALAQAAAGDPTAAREPLDRAVRVLTEAYESPLAAKADTRRYLTNAVHTRATMRFERGEYAPALADLDRLAALASGHPERVLQAKRAVCLAAGGRPGEAAGVAADAVADPAADPMTCLYAGFAFAMAANDPAVPQTTRPLLGGTTVTVRPPLPSADRDRYRARAAECVARAARANGMDPGWMLQTLDRNGVWDAVRDEPEFLNAVCELTARAGGG